MIDFACPHCGNTLSVPSDLAGTDLQCGDCGILLSVPLPSDMANVNPDGTLKLSAPVELPTLTPGRLHELTQVWGTRRVDEFGEEIDNRTLPDDVFDLAPMPEPKRTAPQYDPETGELIAALEIAPPLADLAPPGGAAAAGPAPIGYRPAGAALRDDPLRVSRGQVPLALFQPMNVFVMGVVIAAHVLMNFGWVVVNIGIVFLVVGPLILFLLIAGHYGNMIDEVGPTDMDEVPRPLRQLGWTDDIWGPFCDVFASLMLCSMPVLIYVWAAWGREEPLPPIVWTLAVGAVALLWLAFPAVLLTLRTSGSLLNLRPDRVLGVVRACGRAYIPVLLLGYVTVPLYLLGTFGTFYTMLRSTGGLKVWDDVGIWGSAPVTFAILFVAVYVAHLFAWELGLLYRMFHPRFPWVNQEHVKRERPGRAKAGLAAKPRSAANAGQAPNARSAQVKARMAEGEAKPASTLKGTGPPRPGSDRQRPARRPMAVEPLPPRDYM